MQTSMLRIISFGDIDPATAIQIDLYAQELVKDIMNEDGPASVIRFLEGQPTANSNYHQ